MKLSATARFDLKASWTAVVLVAAGAAIVVSDALAPSWFHSRSLLLLLPIAAALTSSVLITALTIAGATGIFAYLGWARPRAAFTSGYLILLVGCLIVALLVAAVREQHRRRLAVAQQLARAVQRAVLRPLPSAVSDLRIAGAYLAAAEGAQIGGDWYDIQPSQHGVRAVIGDVSGKGLPAIGACAALLGTFRDAGYHERTLDGVARHLEISMQRHNVWARTVERRDHDGFSTALVLAFGDHHVDVIDFGHVPALKLNTARGRLTEIEFDSALPLGLGELAAGPVPVTRVPFHVGDVLVLVTDGVSESRDPAGHFYPLRDRLRLMVQDGSGPDQLCEALIEDLTRYRRKGPADDAAVMVIQRSATRAIEQDQDARRLYGADPQDR